MKNKRTPIFIVAITIGLWVVLFLLSRGVDISILNPKGLIAWQEKKLITTTVLLMLVVVIPVYILTFLMAWKYRAGNTKAAYAPEYDHDPSVELIWWIIPIAIIGTLALITWDTTHVLDPFNPIRSSVKPITIEVVALDWKWLFIYPDQGIATVNFVEFPAATPIDFEITADAPMNSFWIPSLGTQIYAMPGMSTHVHLIADNVGSYRGLSANFSGAGFSGMKFTAQSVSPEDFDLWTRSVRQIPSRLGVDEYDLLAAPSADAPIIYFGSSDPRLYTAVVTKYLSPAPIIRDQENKQ